MNAIRIYGFGRYFYKDVCAIVSQEITDAFLDCLHSGNLIKEVNTTILNMVPNVVCPSSVMEF